MNADSKPWKQSIRTVFIWALWATVAAVFAWWAFPGSSDEQRPASMYSNYVVPDTVLDALEPTSDQVNEAVRHFEALDEAFRAESYIFPSGVSYEATKPFDFDEDFMGSPVFYGVSKNVSGNDCAIEPGHDLTFLGYDEQFGFLFETEFPSMMASISPVPNCFYTQRLWLSPGLAWQLQALREEKAQTKAEHEQRTRGMREAADRLAEQYEKTRRAAATSLQASALMVPDNRDRRVDGARLARSLGVIGNGDTYTVNLAALESGVVPRPPKDNACGSHSLSLPSLEVGEAISYSPTSEKVYQVSITISDDAGLAPDEIAARKRDIIGAVSLSMQCNP